MPDILESSDGGGGGAKSTLLPTPRASGGPVTSQRTYDIGAGAGPEDWYPSDAILQSWKRWLEATKTTPDDEVPSEDDRLIAP